MRILLVSQCHPDMPHVCGQRTARFAEALAKNGHKVVLLTETLNRHPTGPKPETVAHKLQAYMDDKTRRVFHLACPPSCDPFLHGVRDGTFPFWARAGVIALRYFFSSSVFTDWRAGSRPYWPVLANVFQPEVCWGTFGNTEALFQARAVAQLAKCPWIMDIKDSWTNFLPEKLQAKLTERFSGAHGITALSQAHADEAQRLWPHLTPQVIYSGIPEHFLNPPDVVPPKDRFCVTLAGAVYEQASLDTFAKAFHIWLLGLDRSLRVGVHFSYVGTDHERVRRAFERVLGRCTSSVRPPVALEEMSALLRSSHLNVYLRSATSLWHHKIFEYLSVDRPFMVFPEEIPEAYTIVADVGGRMMSCADEASVIKALTEAWSQRDVLTPSVNYERLSDYTWAAQAKHMTAFFRKVTKSK
ncbi:MAG: hypothetical protein A2516_07120 [Alphaproteobacteria bacterium RIFOXYD12_FULL_60_8]|nr:MAG: hypothetical protein A2516_07120 [Alphaproteobacteria bacterium RIFOXYD12_FULL_60_8]